MRNFFKLVVLVSTFSVALTVMADDNTTTPSQPLPKREIKPINPGKHKAPSLVRLLFSYDVHEMYAVFTLPADVDYIDIEAQNLESHIIYVGGVWAENPVWNQELPTGEYIITCTADNGDVYEGYVFI